MRQSAFHAEHTDMLQMLKALHSDQNRTALHLLDAWVALSYGSTGLGAVPAASLPSALVDIPMDTTMSLTKTITGAWTMATSMILLSGNKKSTLLSAQSPARHVCLWSRLWKKAGCLEMQWPCRRICCQQEKRTQEQKNQKKAKSLKHASFGRIHCHDAAWQSGHLLMMTLTCYVQS